MMHQWLALDNYVKIKEHRSAPKASMLIIIQRNLINLKMLE